MGLGPSLPSFFHILLKLDPPVIRTMALSKGHLCYVPFNVPPHTHTDEYGPTLPSSYDTVIEESS